MNTSIVTLLVAEFTHEIWGAEGLVTSIFQVFVLNAIIPWITGVLNPTYWIRVWKRRRLAKKKNLFIT